jgi:WD40-like Beta Propeller Repeat
MNAGGSGQVNRSNDAAGDDNPSSSPDGATIAFVRTRDGNSEIYVMNADGSGQTNITNSSGADSDPDWGLGAGPSGGACGSTTLQLNRATVFKFQDDGTRSSWTGQGELIVPTGKGELSVGGKVSIADSKLAGLGIATSGINTSTSATACFSSGLRARSRLRQTSAATSA